MILIFLKVCPSVPSVCIFSCVIYTFFYDVLSGYFHVLLNLARQLLMFEFW